MEFRGSNIGVTCASGATHNLLLLRKAGRSFEDSRRLSEQLLWYVVKKCLDNPEREFEVDGWSSSTLWLNPHVVVFFAFFISFVVEGLLRVMPRTATRSIQPEILAYRMRFWIFKCIVKIITENFCRTIESLTKCNSREVKMCVDSAMVDILLRGKRKAMILYQTATWNHQYGMTDSQTWSPGAFCWVYKVSFIRGCSLEDLRLLVVRLLLNINLAWTWSDLVCPTDMATNCTEGFSRYGTNWKLVIEERAGLPRQVKRRQNKRLQAENRQ